MSLEFNNRTLKVVTDSGASLTSDNVINSLRDQDAAKIPQYDQRVIARRKRERPVTQIEIEQASAHERQGKVRKKADDIEEDYLQKLGSY